MIEVGKTQVLEHTAGEHRGIRIKIIGLLGSTRMNSYVDIGCDGPRPAWTETIRPLPMIVGETVSTVAVQPWEYVIADKLHAVVDKGLPNTRLKDIRDLLVIADLGLDLESIRQGIKHTFAVKGLDIPTKLPVGLSEAFADLHQDRWIQYLDDNGVPDMPQHLQDALDEIVDIYGDALLGSLRTDSVSYMRR